MFKALIYFSILLISSCATTYMLDDGGRSVKLYNSYLDAPALNKFRSKLITCKQKFNLDSRGNNYESCSNYIRNEAFKAGAKFVVIDRNNNLVDTEPDSECDTCIVVHGDAYIPINKSN